MLAFTFLYISRAREILCLEHSPAHLIYIINENRSPAYRRSQRWPFRTFATDLHISPNLRVAVNPWARAVSGLLNETFWSYALPNHDNSGKPYPVLLGQNSSLWDERDSLVALRRPAKENRLSIALRKHFPFSFKSEKYSSGRIARFSEERLRKVVVYQHDIGSRTAVWCHFEFLSGHE